MKSLYYHCEPHRATGAAQFNDLFATMPRSLAGYYFTHAATALALHSLSDPPAAAAVA